MAVVLNYRFAMRRRTSADWTSLNEVLINSEWGYETDTGQLKIGDGVTAWGALPYVDTDVIPEGIRKYFTKTRVSNMIHQGSGIVVTVDVNGDVVIALDTQYNVLTDENSIALEDENGNVLTDNQIVQVLATQLTGLAPGSATPITTTDTILTALANLQAQVSAGMPPYTLATLPSAPAWVYRQIVVTDATGGPQPCWSDGTNWLRLQDNVVVS